MEDNSEDYLIPVGSLVALRGSEHGPIGVVLTQILVSSFPVLGDKRISIEYRCCMVGKNGKMITMTFSEKDLVIIGTGAGGDDE
tara:strand:- start:96 stop:347 length:252 start_codon:yes stop_codon:yes gene_type:complete